MKSNESMILNARQVDQRITRMAYEIYEHHMTQRHLIFAGVSENGLQLAKLLAHTLEKISPLRTTLVCLAMDKKAPFSQKVAPQFSDSGINKKAVILFDDVLNTGRTAAFALKAFLNADVESIEVAVMVNRSHKSFPIYPKYKGYELSTTIDEHIAVVLSGQDKGVYLY